MKKSAAILPTLAGATALLACAFAGDEARAASQQCIGPKTDTIAHVFVDGVRNDKGLIAITLYSDRKSDFLTSNGDIWVDRVPAQKGTTRTCIYLPKPGTYVVAVYHDENANKKLDRPTLGAPTEAYGFTNNPGTLFGLPRFKSVLTKFPKSGLGTRITLNYP
ncbi:DUF2141 domain-containing protein [Pseudoblastomonas halimionae]|uniref:DUF2141 domain-containing protein n=1 Tax=Alteriqipengyuania halimionae TaxID=1926630 RepID=A0A6I4U4I1_9SPHN|nr:DUF2141 domain-containing protein [Alteriqipengyuania halimionae]MXP10636.1 DUF2141 domain-containing protein [Alteriqipengyuania halimionae]